MTYTYIMLIVLSTVIGFGAQWYVNRQIKKYSSIRSSFGLNGRQMGANMLSYHGVQGVQFRQGGEGEDHFDPRDNSVTLDPHAFNQPSITAIATGCHEVGHACQFAQGYAPMKIRSSLVPVVNFASNAWMIVFVAGIFLNMVGLVNLAILLYAFAVLFHLVTLPVELNASHRAMDYLVAAGLPEQERAGAFSVLRACALTYVAAALVSAIQLLYLLQARNN
ncbi:zinc metallopeptidase [Curtanaerobium respiraculi]|uniref:zinc metallopeptidase n=1 Tax=Curtanaerobium respiraculi TaxID=2949669 RepID=UPI0024B385D5|nr:zinc metallopeptidase [Curtanaerobium respiraculi]